MARHRRLRPQAPDLDITSFMNLMIILVPVLLMSMVFSHITVLDIKLPDLAPDSPADNLPPKQIELVIRKDYMDVNYPAGVRVKRIDNILVEPEENHAKADQAGQIDPSAVMTHDFKTLSLVLQEIKRQLREAAIRDAKKAAEENNEELVLDESLPDLGSEKIQLKRDILILSEADTDYQTIVSAMDTVRSFKTVVAASVVDAELFPVISLGDAPIIDDTMSSSGGAQ